jgi:NAD(P)H-hydrate epimerase
MIPHVLPVVMPEEMAAIDREAPEPVEVLIERAGAAVARAALEMLGGGYGRRVVIVAGKGNNGNDGRAAAVRLRRRGVRVTVLDAAAAPAGLPRSDLVIDAAYGTGFRGEYVAPDPAGVPVLAIDIPSGVDGLTGAAGDGAVRADRTVTFAALKPGLLLQPGRALAGRVEVADIGLDCSRAAARLVEAADVAGWLPRRPIAAHKWQAAVWVVAGSPGMTGAAVLACRGAQRAGAGYVRLSAPGVEPGETGAPVEVVGVALAQKGWSHEVVVGLNRFKALIVGPGLGTGEATADDVRSLVRGARDSPMVVDGDGLTALAGASNGLDASTVLTPHDGEYERLAGRPPGADRTAAARELATASGATVLLKGATTIVASPDGDVLVTTTGRPSLATAGTGDVLSGIIGALLAQGVEPLQAAAAGAWLHGRAGALGPARGLVARDVADHHPAVIDELRAGR